MKVLDGRERAVSMVYMKLVSQNDHAISGPGRKPLGSPIQSQMVRVGDVSSHRVVVGIVHEHRISGGPSFLIPSNDSKSLSCVRPHFLLKQDSDLQLRERSMYLLGWREYQRFACDKTPSAVTTY